MIPAIESTTGRRRLSSRQSAAAPARPVRSRNAAPSEPRPTAEVSAFVALLDQTEAVLKSALAPRRRGETDAQHVDRLLDGMEAADRIRFGPAGQAALDAVPDALYQPLEGRDDGLFSRRRTLRRRIFAAPTPSPQHAARKLAVVLRYAVPDLLDEPEATSLEALKRDLEAMGRPTGDDAELVRLGAAFRAAEIVLQQQEADPSAPVDLAPVRAIHARACGLRATTPAGLAVKAELARWWADVAIGGDLDRIAANGDAPSTALLSLVKDVLVMAGRKPEPQPACAEA